MRVPTIAPPPLPPGHTRAAAVLRDLRAADTSWTALGMRRPVAPTPAAPLTLTDWSARLASDWESVDAQLNRLRVRIAAEQVGLERSHAVAVCMLTQPLFAELADFAAEIDDDRGALCGHVNAERVLLAALAPLATVKAEVAK